MILISKDLEFCVSKPHTLSLGTIVCAGVSCKRENRRWMGEREKREGGRKKETSTRAGARFSRWGYLICPAGWVHLRSGVYVHCTQHVCACACFWTIVCSSARAHCIRKKCGANCWAELKGSLWQWLNTDFYCAGTDPQSPGSRGAARGSPCILILNLTTNKTNEPPGSAQHVRKHATLAGWVTVGLEGREKERNQRQVELFVQ